MRGGLHVDFTTLKLEMSNIPRNRQLCSGSSIPNQLGCGDSITQKNQVPTKKNVLTVLTYKFAYVRRPELRCSSFKGYTLPRNLKITPLKKENPLNQSSFLGGSKWYVSGPFFWASWMLGRESRSWFLENPDWQYQLPTERTRGFVGGLRDDHPGEWWITTVIVFVP